MHRRVQGDQDLGATRAKVRQGGEITVLGYAFQVALLHRLLHSGANVPALFVHLAALLALFGAERPVHRGHHGRGQFGQQGVAQFLPPAARLTAQGFHIAAQGLQELALLIDLAHQLQQQLVSLLLRHPSSSGKASPANHSHPIGSLAPFGIVPSTLRCYVVAQSGRRWSHPHRPPTPPYVRFRIRRFTKQPASDDVVTGDSPVHARQSSVSGAPHSCATLRRSTTGRDHCRPKSRRVRNSGRRRAASPPVRSAYQSIFSKATTMATPAAIYGTEPQGHAVLQLVHFVSSAASMMASCCRAVDVTAAPTPCVVNAPGSQRWSPERRTCAIRRTSAA